MDKNGGGARRPPPPPAHKPTGERKALMPPPPPAARKITSTMGVPRPGSFSGPKPGPEPPAQSRNSFKETLGEKAYENLKALLRAVCSASGASLQQFKLTHDELLFYRDPSSQEYSRFARIEFFDGKPELRIHFDDVGWGQDRQGACRAILKECGQGDASEARILLLTSLPHIYLRIAENGISICAARARDGQPSSYIMLNPA